MHWLCSWPLYQDGRPAWRPALDASSTERSQPPNQNSRLRRGGPILSCIQLRLDVMSLANPFHGIFSPQEWDSQELSQMQDDSLYGAHAPSFSRSPRTQRVTRRDSQRESA